MHIVVLLFNIKAELVLICCFKDTLLSFSVSSVSLINIKARTITVIVKNILTIRFKSYVPINTKYFFEISGKNPPVKAPAANPSASNTFILVVTLCNASFPNESI
ncbi:hypothetical protein SDC9_155050 [bioreactor metagenome]|uniref:Uncharacterized protein n=1 Tax=bioreactor metagenome TaxID=1076179 RepID=A0A645F0D5_9ZZZZ